MHGVMHMEKKKVTFLLLQLLTRVAFELNASCSFINAYCVIGLGIEVEAFRKAVI